MALLSDEQIDEKLGELAGWVRKEDAIRKRYTFKSFITAIEFINAIALRAEEANHHPEIHNVYNRVTITLNTHDEGGITGKDIALAAQIERAATSIGV